jgi:hypothetical protein
MSNAAAALGLGVALGEALPGEAASPAAITVIVIGDRIGSG